jgi:hypothetical protein
MATTDVWYLAYGSNLDPQRFGCYLEGGRPEGAAREYPGCRDASPARASYGVMIDGGLVFAGSSATWGGGMAFLDRDAGGRVAGRAYLVTHQQLADVVAQELRREPGSDVADRVETAVPVLQVGEEAHVAEGQYDALVRVGTRRQAPVVTITRARLGELVLQRPAPAYLWWIGSGLRSAFEWDDDRIASYLAAAPGCGGAWTLGQVTAIVSSPTPSTAAHPG